MVMDPTVAMAVTSTGDRMNYGERDTMLYALGVGLGRDPLDPAELPFVYEGTEGPRVMPTMPVVLIPTLTSRLGIDRTKVLHGEQRLTLHAPLPASGTFLADTRTLSIVDKGAGRGAILNIETVGRLESGERLFTAIKSLFARGDGGCGAPPAAPLPTHAIPDRAPDDVDSFATRPDQALLYRLSGDYNPLHADPVFAARAGFDRPILHGLCSYGVAAAAVLRRCCGHDPRRMRSFDVRFTAPVYPGETIETHIWQDSDVVSFRCRVPARNVTIIDNGRCTVAPG